MLMLLSRNKRKFDVCRACLFICLWFNIFAYDNEYAYKTYEYIRKLADFCY